MRTSVSEAEEHFSGLDGPSRVRPSDLVISDNGDNTIILGRMEMNHERTRTPHGAKERVTWA